MSTVSVSRAKAHFSRIFCDYFGNNRVLQRFSFENGHPAANFEFWRFGLRWGFVELSRHFYFAILRFRDFAIENQNHQIAKSGNHEIRNGGRKHAILTSVPFAAASPFARSKATCLPRADRKFSSPGRDLFFRTAMPARIARVHAARRSSASSSTRCRC